MPVKVYLLFLISYLFAGPMAKGQSCPPNIGFEDGTLNHWECYAGTDKNGNLQMSKTDPIPGRHTVLKNTSPQALDPYGGFPVNCPNGSGYSLMLGNSSTQAETEQVTYTLTIPADNNHFTLSYYYAVVLQNPRDHSLDQQPAFTASIDDITPLSPTQGPIYQTSLGCGNHSFVASSGLPGFQETGTANNLIQYKDWSPVNISLIGYAGHTIKLTFTTRDCTKGGHFGYAYLDFEENCKSPITGNNFCLGSQLVTLTAPPGYQTYDWYKADFSEKLGTDYTLEITPPVDGDKYALVVGPYPGLGCIDTLYTTVTAISELFHLNVQQTPVQGCKSTGVDLTAASVTAGSSTGLKYEYYLDAKGQTYLGDPKFVTNSGTYYIRGSNGYGCTDMQPVKVELFDGPSLHVAPAVPVCKPATINLKAMVSSSDPAALIQYYKDNAMTQPVTNPAAINQTGTYYVKATSAGVPCSAVATVNLIVSDLPQVAPLILKGCPPLNLNKPILAADPDNMAGNTYTFYTDAAATQPVPDAAQITQSGTYYYRAANGYGCQGNVSSIDVTVYPVPYFTVTDPDPVVYPQTVNLAYTHVPLTYANFTYWKDDKATIPLENYQVIGESGTYYIKAYNASDCFIIHPVHVLVNAPPEANLIVSNTFTPNHDGINDEFRPQTQGVLKVHYLKIFNRYGKQVFETRELLQRWNGSVGGKEEPAGTYYWVFSCYDIYRKQEVVRSGSITLIR